MLLASWPSLMQSFLDLRSNYGQGGGQLPADEILDELQRACRIREVNAVRVF